MPRKKTEEPTEKPSKKEHKGDENLRRLTSEEAREIGRKGGKASVKKRREQKTMKELLLIAMNLQSDPTKGELRSLSDCKDLSEAKNSNLTLGDRSMLNIITKAANGDIRALEFIRDQIGQRPREEVSIDVQGKIDVDAMDINELLQYVKDKRK